METQLNEIGSQKSASEMLNGEIEDLKKESSEYKCNYLNESDAVSRQGDYIKQLNGEIKVIEIELKAACDNVSGVLKVSQERQKQLDNYRNGLFCGFDVSTLNFIIKKLRETDFNHHIKSGVEKAFKNHWSEKPLNHGGFVKETENHYMEALSYMTMGMPYIRCKFIMKKKPCSKDHDQDYPRSAKFCDECGKPLKETE